MNDEDFDRELAQHLTLLCKTDGELTEEMTNLSKLGLWVERHEEAITEALEAYKWEKQTRARINKYERALDAMPKFERWKRSGAI